MDFAKFLFVKFLSQTYSQFPLSNCVPLMTVVLESFDTAACNCQCEVTKLSVWLTLLSTNVAQ